MTASESPIPAITDDAAAPKAGRREWIGLAVLAFSGADTTDRVLGQTLRAMTDKTITDPQVLRDMLEEVRKAVGADSGDSATP